MQHSTAVIDVLKMITELEEATKKSEPKPLPDAAERANAIQKAILKAFFAEEERTIQEHLLRLILEAAPVDTLLLFEEGREKQHDTIWITKLPTPNAYRFEREQPPMRVAFSLSLTTEHLAHHLRKWHAK